MEELLTSGKDENKLLIMVKRNHEHPGKQKNLWKSILLSRSKRSKILTNWLMASFVTFKSKLFYFLWCVFFGKFQWCFDVWLLFSLLFCCYISYILYIPPYTTLRATHLICAQHKLPMDGSPAERVSSQALAVHSHSSSSWVF